MSMMRAEGMPSLLQLLRGVFTWSFFFGSIITVFSFMAVVSAEMQALGTYQDLVKARGEVVQINPASFDPTNDGKLVYATGIASPTAPLRDPDFGVSALALFLKRRVEMYQWDEICTETTKKKNGVTISSTRSYAHNRIWYPGPIDSTRFQNSTLYANPPAGNFTLHSWSQKAPEVSLQAFRLRSELVEAISVEEPLRLPEVPPVFSTGPYKSSGAKLFENGVYLGSSPSNPQIGDRRILFSVVKPPAVSIVARQTGKLFMPYQTNKGGEIEIIDRGTKTIDELFARAHQQTSFAAWVQRLFVVPWLAIGLYLLFLSETPLTLLFPGFSSLAQYGSIGRIAPICLSTAAIIVVTVWFAVQSPVIGAIVLTAVTAAALFRTRGEDA